MILGNPAMINAYKSGILRGSTLRYCIGTTDAGAFRRCASKRVQKNRVN